MLGIETKLLIAFHPQTNKQIEKTNQELEQYLRIYINYRQININWLEQLATAEFTFNNKVHKATKSLLFKVNYEKELRMSIEIRKKGKYVKAKEFIKKMEETYKKAKAALKKSQKEMKICEQKQKGDGRV